MDERDRGTSAISSEHRKVGRRLPGPRSAVTMLVAIALIATATPAAAATRSEPRSAGVVPIVPELETRTLESLQGRLDRTAAPEFALAANAPAAPDAATPISFAVPENTPADAADFPGGDANNEISFPMVAAGDMNGDDVDDLVAAYFPNCCGLNGGIAVMLGLGDGTFGEPSAFPIGGAGANRVMGVGLGDFDEDGDLDVFGTVPQRSEYDLWRNDGSGDLGSPTFTPLPSKPGDDLKVADLDGDDHLDVVAGGSQDGSITLFYGRGDGTFADVVLATAQGAVTTVVVGDFDGTGSLDLAWAAHYSYNVTIAKATDARAYATSTLAMPFTSVTHLFAADLDGDDTVDLGYGAFATTQSTHCYSCISALRGNGDGTFTIPPVNDSAAYQQAPDNMFSDNSGQNWGPYSPDPVDVEGDGDVDLVFVYPSTDGLVFVARNQGDATFDLDTYVGIADNSGTRVGSYQINADYTNGTGQFVRGLAAADFDDDGSLDLAVAGEDGGAFTANRGAIAVVRGDPDESGEFLAPKVSVSPGRFAYIRSGFALADWDGDGDNDAIAVRNSDNRAVLFENEDGEFLDAVDIHGALRGPFACNRTGSEQWLESGDLDGDGNDDIVCRGANAAGQYTINVWFGDGAGGADLVTASTYGGANSMPWLHLADIDGDGDTDILDHRITACGPCQMTTVPLRNNGDRTFDELPLIDHGVIDHLQSPVVPVDVDGDDDLDLVSRPGRGTNPPLKVFRNDGSGGFGEPELSPAVVIGGRNLAVHTIVAGDLDKDGDADLVIEKSADYHHIFGTAGGAFVMLGNGAGGFADPVAYTWGGGGGMHEGLADLDGDGNLDLPVNPVHWGVEVMRGVGDGTFEPVQRFWTGSVWGYAARVADIDGDGRRDILKVRPDEFALTLLRNTSTGEVSGANLAVAAVDAPDTVVPGTTATVRATITNTGSRATGRWTDQVWLSVDETLDANDRLLGAVERSGLAGGASYELEVSAAFAPIVNGPHHVIVRADARSNLTETDESDNRAADATGTELSIPELLDGETLTIDVASGDGYVRVPVSAGEQVIVRPDAEVTIDAVRGKVPVPARDLLARNEPLVIPARDEDSTWYLRVAPGDGVTMVQLSRAPLDFGIVDVTPAVIGNEGSSTISVIGDGFETGATVTIERNDVAVVAADVVRVDARRLNARFDLDAAITTGRYSVRVDQGADTATLVDALNVVNDDADGEIEFDVSMPGTVRSLGLERGVPFTVTFRNNGVTDLPAAYLFANGDNVAWDDPAVPGLAFDDANAALVTELEGGPLGVLPPGSARRVEFKYLPSSGGWSIDVGMLEVGDDTVQEHFDEELAPSLTPVFGDIGSPVESRLLRDFGATSGSNCPCVTTDAYVRALNAAARQAESYGIAAGDADDRFSFIVERAFATTAGAPIGGRVRTEDSSAVVRRDVTVVNATGGVGVTTTWFDGRFRVWQFASGPASLSVEGHRPDPAATLVVGSAAARELDVVVDLGAIAYGSVTREDNGQPIEGATIDVYHGASQHSVGYSGSDGAFAVSALETGPAIVVVSAPGLEPSRTGVTLGEAPTLHDTVLATGSTVRGVVLDGFGTPIVGAAVRAEIDLNLPAPAEVMTGADGRFSIGGIPSGDQNLEVRADGFATIEQAFTATGEDTVTSDVVLSLGGTVAGTVTAIDDGAPIPGAVVTVVSENAPPEQVTTDALGRYSIADLAPGAIVLNAAASNDGYVPVSVDATVISDETAVVDVELGVPSDVVGTVTDDAGAAVVGLRVHYLSPMGSSSVVTDGDGNYTLPGVAPGIATLSFGGAIEREVTVVGAGGDVVLDLEIESATASGRVVDDAAAPLAEVPVGIFLGDDLVTTATTNDDGEFRSLVFAAGTYSVRVADEDFGIAEVGFVANGSDDVDLGDIEPGSASLDVSVTVAGSAADLGDALLGHRGSPLRLPGTATGNVVSFVGVEPGDYLLVAAGTGGAGRQIPVSVSAGSNTETADLDAATNIVGRVTRNGAPVELATVVAAGTANGSGSFAVTDAAGNYELSGLAAGDIRVTAYDIGTQSTAKVQTQLGAGGAVVDLALTDAELLDIRVESDGIPASNAIVVALSDTEIPGPGATTGDDGEAQAILASAGPATALASLAGRPVADIEVADPLNAGVVVVDVGRLRAIGLSEATPAPAVKPAVRAVSGQRAGGPVTRDLSETSIGEAIAWLSRHASPAAWVGYFLYDASLEPQRLEGLEASVDANLKALNQISRQPDREFCPGFTESLNQVENLRRQVEIAYSGWESAQQAYDIGWDDATVRLPLGLAKIAASLFLMLVPAAALGAGTTITVGVVAGAGLALGLLDAFVSIVTGGLGALPAAFQSVDGMLEAFNNIKDAISAGGTQAAAALSVWIEGLKALAANPTGAQYLAYAELVTQNGLNPAGVTKLQQWVMKNITWLNGKLPVAELGAKVVGYAGALLDFVTVAQGISENIRLLDAANEARKVGQRNYTELLKRLFAETKRALELSSKDCKKDPKFVLRRHRNLQGAIHIPIDPNEIVGPAGVGGANWLVGDPKSMGYEVKFENLGPGSVVIPPGRQPATIAAALVDVTLPVDPDLDIESVELGDLGWADIVVDVPDGLQSWSTRLGPYEQFGDVFVDVSGEVDRSARQIHWVFKTIDPETGDTPIDERGFLVPENGDGDGQGWARYTVDAHEGLTNGTRLTAKASIVFDTEAPLETNTWLNRIDDANPTVRVSRLPAQAGRRIALAWDGRDPNGSGVTKAIVFVSIDGGPLRVWKSAVRGESATYVGEPGHRYGFAVQVVDAIGRRSARPSRAVTVTRIPQIQSGGSPSTSGFVALGEDRAVYAEAGASFHGSMLAHDPQSAMRAIARTPSGKGYWVVTRAGHVYTFGDARFYGTTRHGYAAQIRTNAPAVAIAGTPSGRGYIIVTADGGVFTFGDAKFSGSLVGNAFEGRVVAAQMTPTGNGYWLVSSRGGVFTFGDARFYGALSGPVPSSVVGFDVVDGGRGYYLVMRNGSVRHFGSAKVVGSAPQSSRSVVGVAVAPSGGVWVVYEDGSVASLGGAPPVRDFTGSVRDDLVSVG